MKYKKVQENGIFKLDSNFHGFTKNSLSLNDPIDQEIDNDLGIDKLKPNRIKWK